VTSEDLILPEATSIYQPCFYMTIILRATDQVDMTRLTIPLASLNKWSRSCSKIHIATLPATPRVSPIPTGETDSSHHMSKSFPSEALDRGVSAAISALLRRRHPTALTLPSRREYGCNMAPIETPVDDHEVWRMARSRIHGPRRTWQVIDTGLSSAPPQRVSVAVAGSTSCPNIPPDVRTSPARNNPHAPAYGTRRVTPQ